MVKKTLLIVNRPFSSNYASLFKQISILSDRKNITLLHKYKTEKLKKYIEETANISISNSISIHEKFAEVLSGKYKSWKEVYENFSLDEKFNEIWVFGAPLSNEAMLKRSHSEIYNKTFNKSAWIKFSSISNQLYNVYTTAKIANDCGIEINEVCYDPGEASHGFFNLSPKVHIYHGYDIDHLNIKRLDSLQHKLNRTGKEHVDKEIDFVLGYSYMNKEREDTHNKVQSILNSLNKNITKKLYLESKPLGIKTIIKYDEYLKEISKAKFTLMLPPYQEKCFSPYRFIEAIHYDCLPFIMEECYVDEFRHSFDIHPTMIDSLLVNDKNINEKFNQFDDDTRNSYITILKEKLNLL